MSSRVQFEELRSLGFAGISAAYAAVGAPTEHEIRLIGFSNSTEGDLIISLDGVTDHMFIAAGTGKVYDEQANNYHKTDPKYVYPVGTQFYVKQVTAPVSGALYIECQY